MLAGTDMSLLHVASQVLDFFFFFGLDILVTSCCVGKSLDVANGMGTGENRSSGC